MTTKRTIDLVLRPKWLFPVIPHRKILNDCCVAIDQEKILGIYTETEANHLFAPLETISLNNHILLPGLINAHGHSAMTLLRGYADDKPLMTWLEQHIWPAEQKHVDEEFVETGSQLAIAEMLATGTTCFSDMYFFPENTAQVAFDSGMRCQIQFPVLDFANNWAKSIDESVEKGMALHDAYRSHDLINVGFGPHAPYTVSDGPLMRISVYAEELQAPVQIHLHETADEIQQSLNQYGMRPIERLADLGFLSPLTQCVHMTQITDSDIEILQQTGASVIHCPESNLKLASGVCPIQTLHEKKITVGIGTDGAASNNDLDLFGELRTAALLAKYQSQNAESLDAFAALEMATMGSAKALGLDDHIGSIEEGKYADLIAIDLSHLSLQPVHHPISQLTYTNISQHVTDVWVAGKQLIKNKQHTTIDSQQLKQKVERWSKRINP